ncbi:MAG: hypothetical protein ACXVD8_12675 [Actinomycetota bacterium]
MRRMSNPSHGSKPGSVVTFNGPTAIAFSTGFFGAFPWSSPS